MSISVVVPLSFSCRAQLLEGQDSSHMQRTLKSQRLDQDPELRLQTARLYHGQGDYSVSSVSSVLEQQ